MEATNWHMSLQLEEDVLYAHHTTFILLHFRSEDIPNWSLDGSPEHMTELYKFWALVHRIFVTKNSPSDAFMLQLESFIPSDDKLQRCKVSPGVIFIFTFKDEDFEHNLHVSFTSLHFEP